ncbi:hypothetical protein [Calycomorphotria hydatis]|uniref:hypothetical protein n=1 Tax=Calycomorphotria hydatis TaxID=2528027 RepID=UPI00119E760B|nr:hypothetical protein [Calycomorphotria hydatis]
MNYESQDFVEFLKAVPVESSFFALVQQVLQTITNATNVEIHMSDQPIPQSGKQLADLYEFRAKSLQQRKGIQLVGSDETIESLRKIKEGILLVGIDTESKLITLILTEHDKSVVGCFLSDPKNTR